jgi:ribosomal protein S21
MIRAEVSKSGNESALSVIRKFSRRVQGTGIVHTARAGRYFERGKSKTVQKKRALKLLERRETYRRLVKEGKVTEAPAKRYGREHATPSSGKLGESTPIAR